MNRSRPRTLLIIGIILLLAAPVCYLASYFYSVNGKRLYRYSQQFELRYPDTDAPLMQAVFEQARKEFGEEVNSPLAQRISLETPPGIGRYTIVVEAPRAAIAGAAGDAIMRRIDRHLMRKNMSDRPRIYFIDADGLRIPTPVSTWPTLFGFVAALVCGVAGVVCLVLAMTGRNAPAVRGSEPPLLTKERFDY